jgi:hypothetical protein
MKKSPVSPVSPTSALSPLRSPEWSAASEPGPSTPTRQPIATVSVDSGDRAARRSKQALPTIDNTAIEAFRMQIRIVYHAVFAKFCEKGSVDKLTPQFLEQAFDSYADGSAGALTDDKFDPADLSVILLAIAQGLPVFVDNADMKRQINTKVLRHALLKDAQIVDVNDIAKDELTKTGIFTFCSRHLDKKQIWGMSLDGKIGVADTGFISKLSKLAKVDLSLIDAFVLPEFVRKELSRVTAKPTVQYRSPMNDVIFQAVSKQEEAFAFLGVSSIVPDSLALSAQPVPDEMVLQAYQDLVKTIKDELQTFSPSTAECMASLIKRCVTYRSIMDKYDCYTAEIDYLYAVYKIIHGSAAVLRDAFEYKAFLAHITTTQGLKEAIAAIIAEPRVISAAEVELLEGPLRAIKLFKSQENYEKNRHIKGMAVCFNKAFGPLYNVYRSLIKNKIDKSSHNVLCMEFHKYLFKSLDPIKFTKDMADRKITTIINQQLQALTNELFKIFEQVDSAIGKARLAMPATPSATGSSAKQSAAAGGGGSKAVAAMPSELTMKAGDSLNPPGSSSGSGVGSAQAACSAGFFASCSSASSPLKPLSFNEADCLSLSASCSKAPSTPGKENS